MIRLRDLKNLPFQVFSDTIVPAVHLSVKDGVHVLGRLDDEVQHLPLVVSEVLDVGGDRDGRVLRDLNAESLQSVIVENLSFKPILKQERNNMTIKFFQYLVPRILEHLRGHCEMLKQKVSTLF